VIDVRSVPCSSERERVLVGEGSGRKHRPVEFCTLGDGLGRVFLRAVVASKLRCGRFTAARCDQESAAVPRDRTGGYSSRERSVKWPGQREKRLVFSLNVSHTI
ncbi:unnamed protein product, partial [Hapterophycus canaliculatus]